MTETPATTLVIVTMPAEDYFDDDPVGPRAVAVRLAADHGGTSTGGGTDLTTGMSDLDFEVPTAGVAAFCDALTGVGLPYRTFAPLEGV